MSSSFDQRNPYAGVLDSTKQFLQRKHRLFIDGQWVDAASGATRAVIDPATGRQVTTAAEGGAQDIDLAVRAARKAFEEGAWKGMSTNERGRIVWKIGELIDAHAQEIAELEVINEGAPFAIAKDFWVQLASDHFRYYAGWPNKLTGETLPVNMPGEWHAYTVREPIGVVGQIVPWNVPFLMAAWKLAPALAAGCTIVLKPAEDTPLTALRLVELCREAGVPDGVINVVTGAGETGAALVAHPDVDKIAFTGSTAVGKAIVRSAADNLKRVTLELGGKSPVFVFPDADLSSVIPGVAQAVLLNAGQACTAGSRLYIHEDVYDRVVQGVAEYASSLKLGHGLDPASQIGPLISERQFGRVNSLLKTGIDEGARLVMGGKQHGDQGFFMQPTLLTDVRPDMTVYRDEIFGPVISAMKITNQNLDELAKEANNTVYGLSASVWTSDVKRAHSLASRIRTGIVWVNSHHMIDAAFPFGGAKQSGWGREMGLPGIEAYTELKSVAVSLN
ncbi:MAG TPA: aldehyde dehydrogenase family protein [Variovorax sp.]